MVYDMTTITLVFTFIGTLVIGAAKYYERKIEGSTEPWDNAKFGLFAIVAGGIMLFEYIYVGSVAFPADEAIGAVLTLSTPIASLFGMAYAVILGGKYVKNGVVIPIVAKIKEDAGTGTIETNWLAMTVTPTYRFGTSPLEVQFNLYGTQPTSEHVGIVSVDIDWGDGSMQLIPMVKGEGQTKHTFSFVKNDKYTGHTFYPIFKANGNDGSSKTYNIEGKMVEIWVQSQ